ncbi:MAG: amidohydrolase [Verrucomicrobia bacterium]|nr:amidohydrolase [Verrucomicrobiota bacterium]
MRLRTSLILLLSFLMIALKGQEWKPQNGVNDPRAHYTAFINANIYLGDGQYLSNASLLIQKKKIIDVGETLILPPNTVKHDLNGKFIYPSFIEINSDFGMPEVNVKSSNAPQLESLKKGPYFWNETIKAEQEAVEMYTYQESAAERYRKMGFGTVVTHQMDGIVRGTSAALTLTDEEEHQLLKSHAAMHYSFYKGKSKQTNPNSLMGIISLIRQLHYDLDWYLQQEKSDKNNLTLNALEKHQSLPKVIDAGNTLSELRADLVGDEFNFQFIIKGIGQEYERIEEIKNTEASFIVPINFPKPYDVSDPFDAKQLSLATMKEWESADENLVHLHKAGISFAITSTDLKDAKSFHENIERAIQKGVRREKIIEALTSIPAAWIGIDDQVGELSKGQLANFIICTDSMFKDKNTLVSNWVAGKHYEIKALAFTDLIGEYSLNIDKRLQFELIVEGSPEKPKATINFKNEEKTVLAKIELNNQRLSLSFTLEDVSYRLSGSANDASARILSGKTLLDNEWKDWAAIKKKTEKEVHNEALNDTTKSQSTPLSRIRYPNKAYGWDSIPKKPMAIVFRNATVWTNESNGILKEHDVVIFDGKIQMVAFKINLDVMFPEKATEIQEIDLKGKHLTSGIIDEHSHIAIEKGVNESSQAVTAEVRIGDVINADDINIYRQLSGGVTAAQLLHGSANPIGGQSALIKLRWGQTPEEMKIKEAEGFIKFALGENVKQSNWGDRKTVRFPQTRMGVEQVFYDAFSRAYEYRAEQKLYSVKSKKDKKTAIAPRTDLELEALVEIIDSQRFITCHSYIQSEINMLMHMADSMGLRINTFTHILEGYKLADKLKAHGAAGSTFSDWWAYKFEVNDAIPYNGALMHRQGVLTGFNSDDAEMGRRLNQEAAKAVKYGGLSEEEAWKFVTLNPAKMLHLDNRMGSIKAGKDADLVVWSVNPLSIYAKAEQTYIDGIKYFDQALDKQMRNEIRSERNRIITLMLNEKSKGKEVQKVKDEKKKLYECNTVEVLD